MPTDVMEHYTEILENQHVELCAAIAPLVDLVVGAERPVMGGEIPVAYTTDGKLLKLQWNVLVRLARAMGKIE